MGHYQWKTLPCDGDEGFDRYIAEREWEMMMSHRSVLLFCAFILSLCLSTSLSLHLFVLWFNFWITSQEQSSAAIPVHSDVPRKSKRRHWKCISNTKSALCFYWIMKNLWWQFDLVHHFQLSSCSACLRYSEALEYLSLGELAKSRACCGMLLSSQSQLWAFK